MSTVAHWAAKGLADGYAGAFDVKTELFDNPDEVWAYDNGYKNGRAAREADGIYPSLIRQLTAKIDAANARIAKLEAK